MSLVQANCKVDFPSDDEFAKWFNSQSEHVYKEMAQDCARYAVENINNHTGNLALSVKAKKSKFEDGGWICQAKGGGKDKGYHAFIVEFGTHGPRKPLLNEYMKFEIDGEVIFAKVVAPMPAKPYMGPARDRVANETVGKLKR